MAAQNGMRNDKLDLIKCIAIYGVICIHVPFPGQFGQAVNCLARFAVPLFFLTAGYFSGGKGTAVLARKCRRTAGLLLAASLFCLGWGCLLVWLQGKPVGAYLKGLATWHNGREFLLYQMLPFPYAWHLWFLGALLVCYLLWLALTVLLGRSAIPYRGLTCLALVALMLHLILGEGRGLLGMEVIPTQYLRNALLDGLPFFILGVWARGVRGELTRYGSFWPWIIGAALLSLLERHYSGYHEIYLGTILAAVLLLAEAIRAPEVKAAWLRGACLIGRELTLFLYILHLPFYGLLRSWPHLAERVESGIWPWLMPVLIGIASTGAALALFRWQASFPVRRQHGKRELPS